MHIRLDASWCQTIVCWLRAYYSVVAQGILGCCAIRVALRLEDFVMLVVFVRSTG